MDEEFLKHFERLGADERPYCRVQAVSNIRNMASRT